MVSYRDIFKWGDKREESLSKEMNETIKKILKISDSEFEKEYKQGNEKVTINKKNTLQPKLIEEFARICGKENVSDSDKERALHSFGKHYAELLKLRYNIIDNPPDIVIYPKKTQEVVELLKFCNDNKIPVIPFGGGSSVTGALQAPQGGVCIDLSKHMNKVLKVNELNSSALVQTGIKGPKLEEELNSCNVPFTCGHFPQSFEYSTVGGWIAARGAGTFSTGYGKIEEMVLSLKIATPSGVIETRDYPADAQAINLNHIFIGSEGVFGIITEACLKIRKFRPNNTSYTSFIFKTFESAVSAMRQSMQAGYGKPHLYRISDPEETDIAFKLKGFENSFSDKILKLMGYNPGQRTLMFAAIEGNKSYTKLVRRKLKKTARQHGAFHLGANPTKKWLEQKYSSAYSRDPLMDKGIITDTFETAVSWENLLSLWKSIRNYLKKRELTVSMIHISHVYENGANLYITFLSPTKKDNELEDYYELHKGLVDTIIKNNGSLSHHHGIGRILAPWMKYQFNQTEMDLLQAIKNNLDPNNIMNPGNMLGLK